MVLRMFYKVYKSVVAGAILGFRTEDACPSYQQYWTILHTPLSISGWTATGARSANDSFHQDAPQEITPKNF